MLVFRIVALTDNFNGRNYLSIKGKFKGKLECGPAQPSLLIYKLRIPFKSFADQTLQVAWLVAVWAVETVYVL